MFEKGLPADCVWGRVEDRTALVFRESIADVFDESIKPELIKCFSIPDSKALVFKGKEAKKKEGHLALFPEGSSGLKRVPLETQVKKFQDRGMEPHQVCSAVEDLDDCIFQDIMEIKTLREYFIPDVDVEAKNQESQFTSKPFNSEMPKWKAMQAMREANPLTPWKKPEEYAYALNQLPCLAERLECWIFIRELPENMARIKTQ